MPAPPLAGEGWGDLRRLGDHLVQHEAEFLGDPGRHGIGDSYFCYFADAEGLIAEYSAEIQRIEDESIPPPPAAFSEGTPLMAMGDGRLAGATS